MSTPTPAPAPVPAAADADAAAHASGSYRMKMTGDTTEEQRIICEITERLKSKIGVRGSMIATLDTASEDELAHTMARSVYAAFCEAGWDESHMLERMYVASVLAEAGLTNDNGTVGELAFKTADVLIAAFREQTRQQRVDADAAKWKRQCVDDDATERKRVKPSETETPRAEEAAGQPDHPRGTWRLRGYPEVVFGENLCKSFTGQGAQGTQHDQQAKKL